MLTTKPPSAVTATPSGIARPKCATSSTPLARIATMRCA
jgi:hypothetical protein